MPQSTTNEIPFRLTYGTKALILVGIGEPLFQQMHYDNTGNVEALKDELNLVDEFWNNQIYVFNGVLFFLTWLFFPYKEM